MEIYDAVYDVGSCDLCGLDALRGLAGGVIAGLIIAVIVGNVTRRRGGR